MQDLSIPDQIAQCEAYCGKRDWEVATTFTDAGASATNDNRIEFQAMIAEACARDKPFDVVIVHSQSRVARNTLDLLHYTKKLEKAEVQFVSITQDIGSGDQADVLRTILGAMDEYQSKETSKHVSRSMCENARQGFWNGAQPPFGYRTYVAEKRGKKDKKKLEINPVEAEIVRRIFKLYIHGEGDKGPMGLKAIANLLNTEGIPTRKGGKFLMQYIHKILNNEAYVTRHMFNRRDSKTRKLKPEDQWILLKIPRIIKDVDFNAVHDRLESNHPLTTSPRVVNSNILLTGLAHLKSDKREMKKQLDALWRQIATEDLRLDASLKTYIEKMQNKYENILRAITRLEYQNDMPLGKFTAKSMSNFSNALRDRLKAKGQTHFRRSYVRSLINRIDVDQEKIKISGSNAVLAGLASNYNQSGRLVPTFA